MLDTRLRGDVGAGTCSGASPPTRPDSPPTLDSRLRGAASSSSSSSSYDGNDDPFFGRNLQKSATGPSSSYLTRSMHSHQAQRDLMSVASLIL